MHCLPGRVERGQMCRRYKDSRAQVESEINLQLRIEGIRINVIRENRMTRKTKRELVSTY